MTTQTNSTTIREQRRYSPKGVCDLFDEAFDLYKSNFAQLVIATAIFYIPVYAIGLWIFAPTILAQQLSVAATQSFLWGAMVNAAILWLVNTLAQPVLCPPVVYIAAQSYLNRPVTIGRAYREAFRRALPLIGAVLLAVVPVAIALPMCGIGLYLICRWFCVPQIILLEKGVSSIGALSRSYRITTDYVGRAFGLLFLTALVLFALQMAFNSILVLVISLLPLDSIPGLALVSANQSLASVIASSLAGLIVFPFTCAVLTVFYYDIRIRREGYDMAILAEQLGLAVGLGVPALPPAVSPLAIPRMLGRRRRGSGTNPR